MHSVSLVIFKQCWQQRAEIKAADSITWNRSALASTQFLVVAKKQNRLRQIGSQKFALDISTSNTTLFSNMADIATIDRYPNCTFLLLQPKDTVKPCTARVNQLLGQNNPPLNIELSVFRKIAEDTRTALEDLNLENVLDLETARKPPF
ncbi:hypothetical protein CPB85DRAFT_1255485 [Mucidula mucida]|nr:hypothetical protein CPB85DRAFT_1255485 [Mucidula mucida]